MPKSLDFKLPLTRVIEPTGGPGVELATLEDAAHFVGQLANYVLSDNDTPGGSVIC
jgi:hypothetical protein